MKSIMKVSLILFTIFSSSFALNLYFDIITISKVSDFLKELGQSEHFVLSVSLAVIVILALDSIFAIPTITTILMAGFLLGPLYGALAASTGVLLAGTICYLGGYYGGERFFKRILPSSEAQKLRVWFQSYGGISLLLARALPMFPEVLSCLAGISRTAWRKYFALFALGNIPFVFLAAYAGSISSLEKPYPALVVGLGLPTLGFLLFLLLRQRVNKVSHRDNIKPDSGDCAALQNLERVEEYK